MTRPHTTPDDDAPHDFGDFASSDLSISASGYVAVFGGFSVLDPRPGSGVSHAVTHDTLVQPDGTVQIRVNGLLLDELGTRQGSHIP